MPKNKSALLRYRIIDGCLTNSMHPYPSLDAIQKKVEQQLDKSISSSMINKDFAAMKEIYGAPIVYNKSRGGYYYSDPKFSIQEFPLTEEEREALDFSTALLQQIRGTRLFQQFENAINKVIEGYRISKIAGIEQRQFLQVEEPVRPQDSPYLEQLLQSIIHQQPLAITYQGYGREPKLHQFSAHLLKEYRNCWYVVGYSDRGKNLLMFALDRIKDITNSDSDYIKVEGFDPDEFFKYSFGITQIHEAKPEKVVLQFTAYQAPFVLNQPLHHSQKVLKQNDDVVEIEYHVYITTELIMTILSYGKEVKVLQPQTLKDKIKATVQEMAAQYK
ncbi:WYL domain-containing protein [Sediminibacterium sp.]|uniref:helix-turn-helix transcriptional regulator n=1 Tax=Sediminibacterium sp. TaxID=1917865 RepID=UPI0025ECD3ED|nr:WYL domain-containing protein [Sediminibacterium sp.]MBT9484104.1 WYL domain-containing protein [Sediminibacterium sp.]